MSMSKLLDQLEHHTPPRTGSGREPSESGGVIDSDIEAE